VIAAGVNVTNDVRDSLVTAQMIRFVDQSSEFGALLHVSPCL
jgi:hypothetical protein